MPEPFALTTADPTFDPRQPVTVNGFLYVPAAGLRRRTVAPNTFGQVRRKVEDNA